MYGQNRRAGSDSVVRSNNLEQIPYRTHWFPAEQRFLFTWTGLTMHPTSWNIGLTLCHLGSHNSRNAHPYLLFGRLPMLMLYMQCKRRPPHMGRADLADGAHSPNGLRTGHGGGHLSAVCARCIVRLLDVVASDPGLLHPVRELLSGA